MLHNSSVSRFFVIFSFALLLIFGAGCAEVRLNTIPAPPPTTKLRVFVLPVTGLKDLGKWKIPHEEWARYQLRAVQGFLRETGIYEMPTEEELASVKGGRTFSVLDWSRKDWSLVRQVGQALHADYAMIVGRGFSKGYHEFEMVLINVETGKRFKVLLLTRQDRSTTGKLLRAMNRFAYEKMFREAKNDMLDMAIRKGRLAGRFRIWGRNSVVQVKRVDVETQGTLGLGTLRCDVGREDELLEHMTELAKEIARKQ